MKMVNAKRELLFRLLILFSIHLRFQFMTNALLNHSEVIDADSSLWNTRHSNCSSICADARNCNLNECSECEFICTNIDGECETEMEMGYIHIKKDTEKDLDEISIDEGDAFPVKFIDITSKKFPKVDSYWYQWKHSGLPYQHESAPLFVDLNDDGILDYFNPMHGHAIDTHGYDRMELAESVPHDFLADGIIPSPSDSDPAIWRLRETSYRIIIDDEEIVDLDPHGRNILDLDNDGIVDMMISSGGSRGIPSTNALPWWITPWRRDNFLLWGENGVDKLTGKKTVIFRGGRQTASYAGVNMRNGRGRVNYMLDVNGDGLMDIFCMQDRHVSNVLAPGILLINQGNRTWREEPSMSEFARAMTVTDVDGDGLAQEIVINRGYCYPQRQGPEKDPNFPEYGSFPKNVIDFCSTRPVGTVAVYKYNQITKKMDNLSNVSYRDVSPENEKQPSCCPHGSWHSDNSCNADSIATGDFDNDQLADHVILFQSKMVFYFSSDHPKRQIVIGSPEYIGAEIIFPKSCLARSVRVIDLDMDGQEEIFISCRNNASFLIFKKGKGKADWNLQSSYDNGSSFGDIGKISLLGPEDIDYDGWCKNEKLRSNLENLNSNCDKYKSSTEGIKIKFAGISIVDLNNDGFLDAVVAYNFGYVKFFQNVPSVHAEKHKSIIFQFTDKAYGVGVSVILYEQRNNRIYKQFREISSYQHSSDKYGYNDDRLFFGLGDDGVPIKIAIRWPDGNKQTNFIRKVWIATSKSSQIVKIRKRTCTEYPWTKFNLWKRKRTCSWLNSQPRKRRDKYCGSPWLKVAEVCPNVCLGECRCKDNPFKIVKLPNDRSLTCANLAIIIATEGKEICRKHNSLKKKCPQTCQGWCKPHEKRIWKKSHR